jgi:hypothetical protein
VEIWGKTTGASHAAENLNEESTTFVVARAAKGGEDPMGSRYLIYSLFAVLLRGVRLCDKVSEEEDSGEVKIGEVGLRIEEYMAAAGTGVRRVFDRVWQRRG